MPLSAIIAPAVLIAFVLVCSATTVVTVFLPFTNHSPHLNSQRVRPKHPHRVGFKASTSTDTFFSTVFSQRLSPHSHLDGNSLAFAVRAPTIIFAARPNTTSTGAQGPTPASYHPTLLTDGSRGGIRLHTCESCLVHGSVQSLLPTRRDQNDKKKVRAQAEF